MEAMTERDLRITEDVLGVGERVPWMRARGLAFAEGEVGIADEVQRGRARAVGEGARGLRIRRLASGGEGGALEKTEHEMGMRGRLARGGAHVLRAEAPLVALRSYDPRESQRFSPLRRDPSTERVTSAFRLGW